MRLLLAVSLLLGAQVCGADDSSELQNPRASTMSDTAKPTPGEALTLGRAVELALANNPALAVHSWDIRAGDARIQQARLRPNPELSIEVEDIRWSKGPEQRVRTHSFSSSPGVGEVPVPLGNGQDPLQIPFPKRDRVGGFGVEREEGNSSGFSESELTISIAQIIELGGKRAKRIASAEREKQLALWDYEAARADVAAGAAKAFVGVLGAQEDLSLQEELMDLAGEVARVAGLRVDAGKASPLERTKADIALASVRAERERALHELHAARIRLAATWGAREALFADAVGDLTSAAPLPPVNELADSVAQNPDIARWASELALREARVELERAERIPDLTVELGFRTTGLSDRAVRSYGWDSAGGFEWARSDVGYDADRENSLVLGFSIPLPLFDRNQGNIAEAEALTGKTGELRRQTEVAVHVALIEAYEEAAAAVGVLDALHQETMPKALDVYEKTQIAYREGKFSYLDVLDAQRTLSETRTAELEALVQYHRAATDMERLTGRPLASSAELAARNQPEKSHAE